MASWICDADLADILGADMARVFTSILGGQRVYVPAGAKADHKIAKAIGLRGMELLCAARGGECLVLPNGRQKLTARRRAEKLLKEGKSLSYVAYACCITMRYAEQIASDVRGKGQRPQQGTLWE